MRMVSKLLSLASAPGITAQMRTWSFLALREITDETLPDNPAAWQDWYEKHGAEKRAQFEHAEWWRVRGDE
jgi:hypothetical protein